MPTELQVLDPFSFCHTISHIYLSLLTYQPPLSALARRAGIWGNGGLDPAKEPCEALDTSERDLQSWRSGRF